MAPESINISFDDAARQDFRESSLSTPTNWLPVTIFAAQRADSSIVMICDMAIRLRVIRSSHRILPKTLRASRDSFGYHIHLARWLSSLNLPRTHGYFHDNLYLRICLKAVQK